MELEMNFREILPPITYKMIRISIEISRKYDFQISIEFPWNEPPGLSYDIGPFNAALLDNFVGRRRVKMNRI